MVSKVKTNPQKQTGGLKLGIKELNPANPLAVLPNGLERSQVAGIKNVFCRRNQPAFFQIVEGVAGADGNELQHARVAVTVNHAAGAAVANEF
jgi:hypothetical protein